MRPSNRKWTWALGFKTLMNESESLIQYTGNAGSATLKAITKPILEDGREYRLWERQHSGFMRQVANGQSRPLQVDHLRQIILSTVHRTALVDLIRQHRIDDEVRRVIVTYFHPSKEYSDAWLLELRGYRRMESSSICARYLAIKLGDPLLRSWLQLYKHTYNEYFVDYCQMILAEQRGHSDLRLWREVVGEAKTDLIAKHRAILGSANATV